MKRPTIWILLLIWLSSTSFVFPDAPNAPVGWIDDAAQPGLALANGWLPDLPTFSAQLHNGQTDQIVGLYLPGVAALNVLTQPADQPYFVTERPEAVTLFTDSISTGSTGLLAHSHLAGRYFRQVKAFQPIIVIYGDGQTAYYRVDHFESFLALSPSDPYSEFISLQDGTRWDSQALFARIYASGPNLILQTCQGQDGNTQGGRLFVIALPASDTIWKGLFNLHR